jgi:hypothetical protein
MIMTTADVREHCSKINLTEEYVLLTKRAYALNLTKHYYDILPWDKRIDALVRLCYK